MEELSVKSRGQYLLEKCTVKISSNNELIGTGFFILPNVLVTCYHVFFEKKERRVTEFQINGIEQKLTLTNVLHDEKLDLICISLDDDYGEYCVSLANIKLPKGGDPIWGYSYNSDFPGGDISTHFKGGVTHNGRKVYRVDKDIIAPGSSGTPLMNLDNNSFLGVIYWRKEENALIIPSLHFQDIFPDIYSANIAYHEKNTYWEDANVRKEKIKGVILKYLRKQKRKHQRTEEKINKLYIQVFGRLAELEINASASDYDELDFSEKEPEDESPKFSEKKSDKIVNLVESIPRLFLRGDPGTGKTFSLKKIYYEKVSSTLANSGNGKAPIFIEAKNYNGKGYFKKTILESLELGKDLFNDLMNGHQLLIIIDGLNEMRGALIDDAKSDIKELIQEFQNVSYIITSRRRNFERYRIGEIDSMELSTYDILPLDEKDIAAFIKKQTTSNKKRGQQIVSQIKKNSNLLDLATNPMYLRMLLVVATKSEKKRIPKSKGELFDKFMSMLLEHEEKEDQPLSSYYHISRDAKVGYISQLASFIIRERYIRKSRIIEILDDQIKDKNKSDLLLKELEYNLLLKQDDKGRFSFVHDNYGEYFAAVWLNEQFEKNEQLPIDIENPQWFEPIVMCSDIFKDAGLLEKYLKYLLRGGRQESLAQRLKGKFFIKLNKNGKVFIMKDPELGETLAKGVYVGCGVAYNIYKKSNRRNKGKYFRLAERYLKMYLSIWISYYLSTGKKLIPVENLFSAVGALSSRKIFELVFLSSGWISVWKYAGSYDVYRYQFSKEELKFLNDISRTCIKSFLSSLNNFASFYFFLEEEVPKENIYNSYKREFLFLKEKLLHNTKSNIQLLKYFFRKTFDFDILKKIGEEDIEFFLDKIEKAFPILAKREKKDSRLSDKHLEEIRDVEEQVINYLKYHPFLDTQERMNFDQLITYQEKILFFRKLKLSKDRNISESLASAKENYNLGNHELAEKNFLEVLKISPGNAISLETLIRYYRKENRIKAGIDVLKRAEQKVGKNKFIDFNLGEFYFKDNQSEKAIPYFEHFIEHYGLNPFILSKICLICLRKGDLELARYYADEMLKIENLLPFFYGIIGDVYKKSGELIKAKEFFLKLLEFDEKNVIIWGNLGDCYRQLKDYKKAVEVFSREYQLNPRNIKSIISIGDCLVELAEFEKALEWYKKAQKIDENNSRVITRIANLFKKQGKTEGGIHLLEKYYKLNPSDEYILVELGNLYKILEKYAEAAKYFEEHHEIDPKNVYTLSNLATCYKELGDLQKAVHYFGECHKLDPNNPVILVSLANCYKELEKLEKAILYLEKRHELNPDDPDPTTIVKLANFYKELGNLEKAILFLEKHYKLDPKNFYTHANLAVCYKKQKKYDQAVKFFKKNLNSDPKNTHSICNLAECYRHLGKLNKATKLLKRAIALNGNDYHLNRQLKIIYWQTESPINLPKKLSMAFNTAIFYDIENLLKGYKFGKELMQNFSLREIQQNIKGCKGIGRIAVQKAYANWSDPRLHFLKNELIQLGIEPIQVFGFSKNVSKNASQIQLTTDIMDLTFTRPSIEIYVIVSGDGSFAFLARKMHEYGKTIIGCTYKKSANKIFEAVSDHFIWIDDPEVEFEDENLSSSYLSPFVKILDKHLEKIDSDKVGKQKKLEKIKEIVEFLGKERSIKNELRTEGIVLSELKQGISHFVEDFEPIKFGQVKFVDFVRMVCSNSDLAVYRVGEDGQPRLGLRVEGLEKGELLDDVEKLDLHSIEGYRKVLGYQSPVYRLPSKRIVSAVANTIADLGDEKKSVGELLEEIPEIMEDEFLQDDIKKLSC
jgi:tetratricopeptide (TPR) repeat protein